jgi:hypothetical protein
MHASESHGGAPVVNERSKCWTCDRVLPDAEIALCKRNYCTAQTALGKPQGTRPPQKNPGEVIDYTDSTAGLGDAYDTWSP